MKSLKKMVKVIALGALAASLVACGGNKKAEEQNEEKIKIGELKIPSFLRINRK